VEKCKGLKLGRGTDETSDIGPVINRAAYERIKKHISDARKEGADVV